MSNTDIQKILNDDSVCHRQQPLNRFLTIGKRPSCSSEEPGDLCETGSSSDPSVVCSDMSVGTLLGQLNLLMCACVVRHDFVLQLRSKILVAHSLM